MGTQTREEWLAERKSGIGGSDAAAVLGFSPWATPVNVWLDKTGRAEPKEETEAMRIGTELEDFVARRYCQETGRTVQRFNKMIHKGCLLGNFDRLVVPDGEKVASHMGEVRTNRLLECKTSSREWDGVAPIYYEIQVFHYMGLEPRLQYADIACLFLNRKHFEIFGVKRDDEVINAMQEKLTAWWEEYVVGNKMPPPTNETDCKLLWARSNPGKTIESTEEIRAKLEEYNARKSDEKAAKEAAAALQSDICAFLGDSEVLLGADGKPILTWKSAKDTSKTDWEALARWMYAQNHTVTEVPAEWIAKFTKTTPGSRRFTPKATKADKVA